jgi:murein DD-endopeptidase MepM/ murein hydrolase activator NlpD
MNGVVTNQGGGTRYVKRRGASGRQPAKRQRGRRRASGPVLATFALRRSRLFLFGPPARVTFRIRSRAKLAKVRITITRRGARKPSAAISLASVVSGRERSVDISGQEAGPLAEGAYRLRISARDVRGRRLRRAAGASATSGLAMRHHRFPLGGSFSWGGPGARFGAGRAGHSHQGQDLAAPEGTPVLAPRGGIIKAVQYQAKGAGHYVVVDGAGEERDYVFMHLRTGSVMVREGQSVRTGQRIAEVGNTGRSFGAHLHFEVWNGGGWYSGGRPLDPLPLLQDWARPIRSPA